MDKKKIRIYLLLLLFGVFSSGVLKAQDFCKHSPYGDKSALVTIKAVEHTKIRIKVIGRGKFWIHEGWGEPDDFFGNFCPDGGWLFTVIDLPTYGQTASGWKTVLNDDGVFEVFSEYEDGLQGICIEDNDKGDILDIDFSCIPSSLEYIQVNHSDYITACQYDAMFTSLPDRSGGGSGRENYFCLTEGTDLNDGAEHCNTDIAQQKGWNTYKWNDGNEIPFTGDGTGCEPNSRYITLDVKEGQKVNLDFYTDAAYTPVKIVSGSKENVYIYKGEHIKETAGASTMTVYGDVDVFYCRGNGLTGLDVSHNTGLQKLYCESNNLTNLDVSPCVNLEELRCSGNNLTNLDLSYNTGLQKLYCNANNLTNLDVSACLDLDKIECYKNNFTTQALNKLYCSLPTRNGVSNGKLVLLEDENDANYDRVMASDDQNASDLNWNLLYDFSLSGYGIPSTAGHYVCGSPTTVDMDRYIKLNVQNGATIKLDLWANANNTPVKIVSGTNEFNPTVGNSWTGFQNYTAGADTMLIYGNILYFSCSGNGNNISGLDVSHNDALEGLMCHHNALTQLDVSKNEALTLLDCSDNQLADLEMSRYAPLAFLDCSNNQLTKLSIHRNANLKKIKCYDNPLPTEALDKLYCSLYDRNGLEAGIIQPVYNSSSSNHDVVMATNAPNAENKNWKVQYADSNNDIPSTTGTYHCIGSGEVNLNRYVVLNVKSGSTVRFNMRIAGGPDTPIKIVSGGHEEIWKKSEGGSTWFGQFDYYAGGDTMTIYGDIVEFDCSQSYVTGLDVSHNKDLIYLACYSCGMKTLKLSDENMALTNIYCYDNDLSSNALDELYCSLPDRSGLSTGSIYPVNHSSSSNHDKVVATNAQNAVDKNWEVKYVNGTAVPTTGAYDCSLGGVDMNRYIKLNVQNGEAIRLDLWADANQTPVRIVSGSEVRDIAVDASWTGFIDYTAGADTMLVYGNVLNFDCCGNNAKISGLDVSHNTPLTVLFCQENELASLDVSQNTDLRTLNCRECQLNSLDLSQNTNLKTLYCQDNQLASLDVSQNTNLKTLCCQDNNFTKVALDKLYCSLPDRGGLEAGIIQPVYNSSSSNHDVVMATNAQNAVDKNWKVQYYEKDEAIPATTGKYDCSTGVEMGRFITLMVKTGEGIKLKFKADAAGTPVKIRSGGMDTDVTVGTAWTAEQTVTAADATMTVYGDLTGFDCSGNGANLTALDVTKHTDLKELNCSENELAVLDVSYSTKLESLDCYKNNFSTDALNLIYCALPDRGGLGQGEISPLWETSDANHPAVLATNASNATAKNWKVMYQASGADISTTGTYACGASALAVSPATLTMAATGGTKPITVTSSVAWTAFSNQPWLGVSPASGTNNGVINATVAPNTGVALRTGTVTVTGGAFTQTVKIMQAGTGLNMSRYITLNVKKGEGIKFKFKSVVSGTNIKVKSGTTDVDIAIGTIWTAEQTFTADDATMTVYGDLTGLDCSGNGANLTALDVTKHTELKELNCSENQLAELDVRNNTELERLECYKNNFSTVALDRIYCALPDRTSKSPVGMIVPAYDNTDPGHAAVLATNTANATAKNWKVGYGSDGTDIPATGTYNCGSIVSPATLNMAATGETQSIAVTSSTAWTASSNETWLTLSPANGTGNGVIQVTATANTGILRMATVTVTAGSLTATVTVTQAGEMLVPEFVVLDHTDITLPAGGSKQLNVTVYPETGKMNRNVSWYSINKSVATVNGSGTVRGISEGVTSIFVVTEVGERRTQCRVRVVPTVFVTPIGDGKLQLSLMMPAKGDFTLSFDLDLPEGFTLDKSATKLDASLKDAYAFTVSGNRIEVKPSGLRAGMPMEKRNIMTIAYLADASIDKGDYKGSLVNLGFVPTDGDALHGAMIPFDFTYSSTANTVVDGLRVYAFNGELHISLPEAQTVRIYNVSGALVKELDLPAGDTSHPLPMGFYVVRLGTQVKKVIVK